MRRHPDPDPVELAARPTGSETGIDSLAAVQDRELRELPDQEEGMLEADVRGYGGNPKPLRQRGDDGQHRQLVHPPACRFGSARRGRGEDVVAEGDAFDAQLVPAPDELLDAVRLREETEVRVDADHRYESVSFMPVVAERAIASQISAAR